MFRVRAAAEIAESLADNWEANRLLNTRLEDEQFDPRFNHRRRSRGDGLRGDISQSTQNALFQSALDEAVVDYLDQREREEMGDG